MPKDYYRIIGICGSPRKGNSEFMLRTVLDSAKSKGAETELVLLREKNIKHCAGCLYCDKHNTECSVKDDMNDINNKLLDADVIVLATPNYYENVTGLMKDFIDRTNPFYKSQSLKGKRLYLLVVGGDEPEACAPVIDSVKRFANFHEMSFVHTFAAKALNAGEIEKQKETIKKLKQFGEKLA